MPYSAGDRTFAPAGAGRIASISCHSLQGIHMKTTVIAALLAVAALSACTKTEKTTTVTTPAETPAPVVVEKTIEVPVPVPVAVPGPAGPAGEKGDTGATGKQGDTVVVVPDANAPAAEPAK